MATLYRIYFNAVFGGLGGLLAWMLNGVFANPLPSTERVFLFLTGEHLTWLLTGAIVGGIIGYFVVSVEAILDLSIVKFARLASYGLVLGAIGGALGGVLGTIINSKVLQNTGGALIPHMIARGLGWCCLGAAIGISEGLAARSMGKLSYGTLGGAIGGFVGGCLYMLFYFVDKDSPFWQAVGLIILGACIGSLSALVQAVFQPACLRVLRGWQEGREYPLEKDAVLLGRDEHADIALFRDMKVEKKHCFIRRSGERFVFVNNAAPAENTLVNEKPVAQTCELHDGDRIQLGNVLLRFQLRAAFNRARARRQPLGAAPIQGVLVGRPAPPKGS